MPNLFEKIFMSKYELGILKLIEKYDVRRNSRSWTEKIHCKNREFNRSSTQFSVTGDGMTVTVNREYEEKLEASLMPATYFVLTVQIQDGADSTDYRREFDTRFAHNIYKKMLTKYQTNKYNAR